MQRFNPLCNFTNFILFIVFIVLSLSPGHSRAAPCNRNTVQVTYHVNVLEATFLKGKEIGKINFKLYLSKIR